jgi:hypothetical protein
MNRPTHIFKYFTEDRIDILENGLIRYTHQLTLMIRLKHIQILKQLGIIKP